MKNLSLYLVYVILLFSCHSFNQKEVKYFKDGTLSEVCYKKNGKLNGRFEAYFPNGQLRSSGIFKNGEMDGKWKYWYMDGTILSIQEYKYGRLISLNSWDKNSIQTLKDGTGVALLYYLNGNVMSRSEYKDCVLDGKTETWFESGNKESKRIILRKSCRNLALLE
ncbi:MAG: hypothetical protein U0Z17_03735 [Bacteroidales bacterium]